jgi:hypothetical protein
MVYVSCVRTLMLDAIVDKVLNGAGSVAHESKELQAEGSYRYNWRFRWGVQVPFHPNSGDMVQG